MIYFPGFFMELALQLAAEEAKFSATYRSG